MKTTFKILGILVGLLLVGAGALYVGFIAPNQRFVEQHEPEMVKLVTDFQTCLTEKPVVFCRDTYMTTAAQGSTSIEGLAIMAVKLKTNLGKRLSSKVVEKTVNWEKKAQVKDGVTFQIGFDLATPFEKDPQASESVILHRLEDNSFRLHAYRINSNEMLK